MRHCLNICTNFVLSQSNYASYLIFSNGGEGTASSIPNDNGRMLCNNGASVNGPNNPFRPQTMRAWDLAVRGLDVFCHWLICAGTWRQVCRTAESWVCRTPSEPNEPRIFQSHAHAGHNFAAGERSLDVSCRVPTDLDIVWVC